MRNVVCFWYLLISLRATVPALHLLNSLTFLTPPSAGAVFFLATFDALLPVATLALALTLPFFPAIFYLGIL